MVNDDGLKFFEIFSFKKIYLDIFEYLYNINNQILVKAK